MTFLKTLLLASILIFMLPATYANDDADQPASGEGTGIVAETMVSGGYRYVRLKDTNRWIASSPADVVVGDKVKFTGGAEMKDFHSPTLERTFDYILFVMDLKVINEVDAEKHANMAANDMHGIAKSAAATAPQAGEITPAEGGKTIAEVRAEYQQLEGEQVTVHAQVMKVSKNILGKNWITLQDGTGTAPDNKLLATSSELVEIGELVTVTGKINTDVDLGSGYMYKVVLEEATFTR